MDAETAVLLRASLAGLFAGSSGPAALERLAELGWAEVAAADPEAATALLFEAQGRAQATTPALDLVVLAALAQPPGARLLHPYPGGPGPSTAPGAGRAVRGVALGAVGPAPLVVPTATTITGSNGAVIAVVVDRPEERFEIRPVEGMAPEMGLVEVSGTLPADPAGADVSAAWPQAVAAAQRALAHELNAITAVMLGLAVEHAGQREQFGQPIGRFQAVQHRLADVHVALEAARTSAAQAGETAHEVPSAAAKALSGKAFRSAARHCQQVLGAIGFTWEHPFHLALRRGMVLEVLYGGASPIARELGLALQAADPRLFRQLASISAQSARGKASA